MKTRTATLMIAATAAAVLVLAPAAGQARRTAPPAQPKPGLWADPTSPEPLLFRVKEHKVKAFNAYVMLSCTTAGTSETHNYLFNTVERAPVMPIRRVGRRYEAVADYTDSDVSRTGAVHVAISFTGRRAARILILVGTGGEEQCSGSEGYDALTR